MDTKQLWKNCLAEIELGVSKANFSTWFKNTSILREDMGIIYVGVPNEFVRDWLKNKYHKLITKTIADAYENMRAVEYIITKIEASKQEPQKINETFVNKELPLKDLYINPEDNLNSRYHFNSFIVGGFNELAYAASQARIENPGTKYNHIKQIIFSSDKHPNYIPELADRLKSRFAAGMIVDVSEPEYESRLAILKVKLQELGIDLDKEIVEYVAEAIEGNIRELEGSLNTIVCQYRLKNRPLSLTEVKNLLKNNIKPKKNVAIKDVVKIVSDYYNLDETSIYEKTRRKEIVKARQVVMYLLREDFNVSYPLIGQKLGGKDHTTVIHSYLKIKGDLKNDPHLQQELEVIRVMFK
ncbi:hypothetical protein K8Q98_01415 [Candidatus Nomurabacteria bacterium]|nr:hypothetical protein [Candidatus Nomurabacteria bacterium]